MQKLNLVMPNTHQPPLYKTSFPNAEAETYDSQLSD